MSQAETGEVDDCATGGLGVGPDDVQPARRSAAPTIDTGMARKRPRRLAAPARVHMSPPRPTYQAIAEGRRRRATVTATTSKATRTPSGSGRTGAASRGGAPSSGSSASGGSRLPHSAACRHTRGSHGSAPLAAALLGPTAQRPEWAAPIRARRPSSCGSQEGALAVSDLCAAGGEGSPFSRGVEVDYASDQSQCSSYNRGMICDFFSTPSGGRSHRLGRRGISTLDWITEEQGRLGSERPGFRAVDFTVLSPRLHGRSIVCEYRLHLRGCGSAFGCMGRDDIAR